MNIFAARILYYNKTSKDTVRKGNTVPEFSEKFVEDVNSAKERLARLETDWEGKASVLKMKEVDFQWRQMEWWGFYFEMVCRAELAGVFEIPGDRYGTVTFDLKRSMNWDYKAKAIKSDDHRAILNDKNAIEQSVAEYKEHGVIVALCDVEYNDNDRSFQKWHTELKGGLSEYENKRIQRTSVSRYRKTRATLTEILFLCITPDNLKQLSEHRQGRNSNGAPRPLKYMIDLEELDSFLVDRIQFPKQHMTVAQPE